MYGLLVYPGIRYIRKAFSAPKYLVTQVSIAIITNNVLSAVSILPASCRADLCNYTCLYSYMARCMHVTSKYNAMQESTYVHHNIVEIIIQFSAAYCLIYDVTTYYIHKILCVTCRVHIIHCLLLHVVTHDYLLNIYNGMKTLMH